MEGVKRRGQRKGAKYGEDGAVRRRRDEGEERENSTKLKFLLKSVSSS